MEASVAQAKPPTPPLSPVLAPPRTARFRFPVPTAAPRPGEAPPAAPRGGRTHPVLQSSGGLATARPRLRCKATDSGSEPGRSVWHFRGGPRGQAGSRRQARGNHVPQGLGEAFGWIAALRPTAASGSGRPGTSQRHPGSCESLALS